MGELAALFAVDVGRGMFFGLRLSLFSAAFLLLAAFCFFCSARRLASCSLSFASRYAAGQASTANIVIVGFLCVMD